MNGGEKPNFNEGSNSDAINSEHQHHGVISSRRYRGPSDEQKYAAATNLASNPNTPDFFSEAVMANTAMPQPRKSHKKLIIIVIALIAIVAIVAISLFMMNRGPKAFSDEGKKVFRSFANFYFLNDESDNPDLLKEYNIARNESFAEKNPYNAAYVSKLQQKYSDFLKMAQGTTYDEATNIKITELTNDITFIAILPSSPELGEQTAKDIFEDYKNTGKEGTINVISDKYRDLVNSKNNIISNYASALREQELAYLEILQMTRELGCLVDNDIDTKCNGKKANDEQLAQFRRIEERYQDAYRTSEDIRKETYLAAEKIIMELLNEIDS